MSIGLDQLQVLLIQIRADNIASMHERECILEISGLSPDQLEFTNLAMKHEVDPELYERADAVIIGGSGSHSVVNDDPFTEGLIQDVKRLVDSGKPLLGSCWGHQFLARALGGEVVHDPDHGEVGICQVHATEAAAEDRIFSECPNEYPVLMGHHDRVVTLPPGATELAYNETSRNQAFGVDGTLAYGTQFHSELLPERLIERLKMFRQYMPDDEEFERLESNMRPTPDASRIMSLFLEVVAE